MKFELQTHLTPIVGVPTPVESDPGGNPGIRHVRGKKNAFDVQIKFVTGAGGARAITGLIDIDYVFAMGGKSQKHNAGRQALQSESSFTSKAIKYKDMDPGERVSVTIIVRFIDEDGSLEGSKSFTKDIDIL